MIGKEIFVERIKAFDDEEMRLVAKTIPMKYLLYGISEKLRSFEEEKRNMEEDLKNMGEFYNEISKIIHCLPSSKYILK